MPKQNRFQLPHEFDRDTITKALTKVEPVVVAPSIVPAPDISAAEMSRLFSQTQRGPFSGYRPELVTEEIAQFAQAPGSIAEDNLIPLYLSGYIVGRVHNDRFLHGPPDGDGSDLDDAENKLPGWSAVDETTNGGRIQYQANVNGGGYLRFFATNAQVGDRLYIEQYVFVSGGNYDTLSVAADWTGDSQATADYDTFISTQYVYPNGALQGAEEEAVYSNSTSETLDRKWLVTSSRLYAFVRVRIGIKVDAAWADGEREIASLFWTWVEEPESYDVTIPFLRTAWSPTNGGGEWFLKLFDSGLSYGAGYWTAPGPGIMLSMSVYTTDTIAAGAMEFFPRVDSTNRKDLLTATIAAGETRAIDFRDMSGATSFDFAALNLIDVKADETGALSTTGNAEYVGTLQVRIVVAFDVNAPGGGGGPFGPAGG